MTRPSFRNTSRGGTPRSPSGGGSSVWGSPFSQAQILHLMKTEFARARRHDLPLAVSVFQVDRLLALVDLYGAELREAVRDALGRLMVEGTRSSDYVGTSSDDRFVLLMPHTDGEQAAAVAERVIQRFGELSIRARGQELALMLSAGLATNADKETLFFDTLLSQAEVALEWAQRGGRTKVVVFSRERFSSEEGAGEVGLPPAPSTQEES
ncbi:MAG: GGDEF domain-containing protein [Planctomycetota bacterium]